MLEYSNLFFSSLFAVEMLLKMIAEGFFGYVKNGFNLFDSFIVILRFDYIHGLRAVYCRPSAYVNITMWMKLHNK